jgi:hypothetical protein
MRPRRFFAPEYKAKVIELIRSTDKGVGQVAHELDLTGTAGGSAAPNLGRNPCGASSGLPDRLVAVVGEAEAAHDPSGDREDQHRQKADGGERQDAYDNAHRLLLAVAVRCPERVRPDAVAPARNAQQVPTRTFFLQ